MSPYKRKRGNDMKKRVIVVLLAVCLLAALTALALRLSQKEGPPVSRANARNAAALLTDLVTAAESPSEGDAARIAADLDAVRSVSRSDYRLLKAIADHWQQVYLDPTHELCLYRGDGTAPELMDAGIPDGPTHAIVVLGFELMDGEMQQELVGRCEAAAAAARALPNAIMVCSGGATGPNNPDGHTEAGLMKAYLTEKCGIDPARIYIDEAAMTTQENAVNTFRILQENGVKTMTIVTSAYHQRWGEAVYHTVAELYRRQHDYPVEIVGSFSLDKEPDVPMYAMDARIAAFQIAGILELPEEARSALPSFFPEPTHTEPDYAKAENWAYYGFEEDREADVFLICPTVDMNDEYNMSMDDEETRASFLGALNMERGIYEDSGRVFAPYYRQAAMKVYDLTAEEREPYLALAYADVSAAFSYYLENENNGRPIILAGFSQGADMCYRLLAEYFGEDRMYHRLAAVYAIGWPCTDELIEKYPQIVPATGENDVGVVVSFDCEAPEVTETFIYPAGTRGHSINPLNWRTDGVPADKGENPGACFTDYSGAVTAEQAALCGAYLDTERGVLKVTDIDPADYPAVVPGLPEGAYHVYDYMFFFRSLQANVGARLDAYLRGTGESIEYWTADSPAMKSITEFVAAVTDESAETYTAPEDRIAVFDFDGTLYGELFPTYFDQSLFLHRALHDPTFTPPEDVRAYAEALETAVLHRLPEPDSPRSTAQMAAECFKGFTPEEYSAYVREFMAQPVAGFEGMTYAEGFYKPMIALVKYLADHGFSVFVSSGSERTLPRELMAGVLDQWIPPWQVIGSTFSLAASGQGDKDGRSYTYAPEDRLLMEGNLLVKNQKTNKVFSIVNEIGRPPLLVFGNSSGDLAMAQYAVQHGGRAYMLLCDDLERDHGDAAVAEKFRKTCESLGFETVSMRDEFETIYGDGPVLTGYTDELDMAA